MVMLLLVCICVLGVREACDMPFYFKTDGKLCNTETCFDMNMFVFPITYGSSVCFKDINDEVTEFKMSKCQNRIRMNKVYYVGSPKLNVESMWKCEGTQLCEKDSCRIGTKLDLFKQHGLDYYGCQTDSSPCDTYCMWSSQCVYYHYWIEKPEKLYPVYKLASNVWEIEVLMSKNGVTTVNTLNVNNPSVNMVIQKTKFQCMSLTWNMSKKFCQQQEWCLKVH